MAVITDGKVMIGRGIGGRPIQLRLNEPRSIENNEILQLREADLPANLKQIYSYLVYKKVIVPASEHSAYHEFHVGQLDAVLPKIRTECPEFKVREEEENDPVAYKSAILGRLFANREGFLVPKYAELQNDVINAAISLIDGNTRKWNKAMNIFGHQLDERGTKIDLRGAKFRDHQLRIPELILPAASFVFCMYEMTRYVESLNGDPSEASRVLASIGFFTFAISGIVSLIRMAWPINYNRADLTRVLLDPETSGN